MSNQETWLLLCEIDVLFNDVKLMCYLMMDNWFII